MILKEFRDIALAYLQSQRLNLRLMPMLGKHNLFIGIDSKTMHAVYTTEGASEGMVTVREMDLRDKGVLSQSEVASACVSELGWKDIFYFGFPVPWLEQTSEQRRPLLEELTKRYVQARVEPLARLNNLGLSEALRYIRNAQSRFDTHTPEGYADCKSNCRNALVSCVKALADKDNLREGVHILGSRGLIGEREEELIVAFGDLFAKLYSAASKKGPHPPLASRDDAELVLGITTSIINYLSARALQST